MDAEEKKRRYKEIVYRLRLIDHKLEDLNNSVSSLKGLVQSSISIDDKGVHEEELRGIHNQLTTVSKTIERTIIPSLTNKIYN